MENVPSNIEESKVGEQREHQQTFDSQENPESLIENLILALNNLFEPNNLSNNHYLIQRAQGVSFNIPIKFIYDENSIRALTYDRYLIDQAIERAENVIAIKRGDLIEAVKPKIDQLKKTIIVKGITKDDETEIKQLVNNIEGSQEGISNWHFNQQLNVINIVCKDEKFASELYNHLIQVNFKDSPLDCSLNFENLYIAALENMKKRPKRPYDPQKRGGNYNMMPQFQMPFFFNPMNNGGYMKSYYPQQNFYMQQRPYNTPMNPTNINGPVNRPQQNYYYKNTGGGRRGGFNKKGPGKGRGGRYHKNGGKPQPSNVEVNDSDFPPLSNEKQEEEEPQQ